MTRDPAVAADGEARPRGARQGAFIDPDGAEHGRFFAHLRRLIALGVEHRIREAGLAVDPTRLPKRK